MTLKEDLVSIVGAEYVSDDPDTLEKYSKDYSFVQPRRPSCVARPKNTEEVQRVVKYANEHLVPVTPRSSGVSFYGAGIPSQGGIILDLTRMNRIWDVNGPDKRGRVEPGVTWAQLQEELGKDGLMVCNPLLPHPEKSVLTSSLERDPLLIPKSEYAATFCGGEVVLGTGELYYLGTAIGKGHTGRNNPNTFIPGTPIWTGAQGTLGIITWATLKVEFIPTMDKLFFIPFERVEDISGPIHKIQRRMLGYECFVQNSLNLAAILAEKGTDEINTLREVLPPWTLILCLSGPKWFPEEKIAYEEEALLEIASEMHFDVLPSLPGVPGAGRKILSTLRRPCQGDEYWKFRYKGACHDIFFHTTLNRVPEFTEAINRVAAKYRYSTKDIGFYLQPVERGRISHCEYGFHCDPSDAGDVERVRNLYLEASELIMNMGGFFATPYGPWADMVYSRTATFTATLKILKNTFDPNKILNPGKLCF